MNLTDQEIADLRAKAEAATPGPWRWELNEKSKRVTLQGGKPKFDCSVMDFIRYGFNGAMPRFVIEPRPNLNIMKPCTEFAKEVAGREHHADWFKTIDNQDANFIAAANPAAVLRLLDEIERLRAENEGMRKALDGVPDPAAFMAAVDEMLKTDSLTIESYRQVFWQRLKNLRSARRKH